MINLPGYQLKANLYQGTRTLVYQGTRNSDHQPVIIKILRNQYPTFNELLQFRNQYTIAKNLKQPGIIQTYNLEIYGNGYALVMEDFGGISLAEFTQGKSLEIQIFLPIAIQLADILHGLYQNRVIHKDIKPANILIHPETQEVKLIDFSISSLLPRETQEIQNPNILEGTLAYISPEQTGRMNRGIDYRTDFYSLGVTFYQLLSGKLPFFSDDPMELVHCHIAKKPATLKDYQNLPQILSDIVFKLMAKNAEDRYQSAFGLKYDLEQCLQQLETTGKITPFELGKRDLCERFMIPEKLYGRETEVQQLLDAFERVANPPLNKRGGSEMMLVAGFSGIGKTAVVNEVHKPIVRQRGYFIKGKYDQFNRNIPFSAFVQAFRDLMSQLLCESDTQLENWKTQILKAVGVQGQVIIDVIPELEYIIGPQPSVPELAGSAAQNRFNLLFSKFVRVFTTKEHPLVIFLDDLQWADSASLNLLKLLMEDSETGYLLVLGAYRDHEVFPAHPLMLSLDELRTNQAIINTINLEPLTFKQMNQLISETLICSEELAQPLSKLVNHKTQGNPFFTTQFLKGLQVDKQIIFNQSLRYWECDIARVRDAALTSDVVEFMAGRLQKLPKETQNILKLAACIGNQFDLETLAIVCEESQEEVATEIWGALQEGLILPISEAYKFFQGSIEEDQTQAVKVSYRFLHDRVQQAAYSLIPEERKQLTHLTIGRLLLHSIPKSEQEEKIFSIVNQLNRGSRLIEEEKERENLAKLNLRAGEKAKLSTAFSTALKYGKKGIQLLSAKAWQQYKLCLELHQLATEAAYSAGEFEVGIDLIELVLKFARTILDKVRFYQIKIDIYVAQKQGIEAIEVGRQILGMLGIELPQSLTPEETQQIFTEIEALIPEGKTEALLALPTSVEPSAVAVMQTLVCLSTPIFTNKPELFPLLVANGLKQTLKHGTTAFSAVSYSYYSMLLCSVFNDLDAAYQFGELALKLLPRFNNKIADTQVWCIAAFATHHWKIHFKDTLSFYQKGAQAGLEVGYFANVAWNYVHDSYLTYLTGVVLSEAEKKIGARCDAIRQLKQESHLSYNEFLRQCVLNLQYPPADPCNFTGDILDEEKVIARAHTTQDTIALFFFYFYKLQLCYLLGRYEQALKYVDLTMEYSAMAGSFPIIPVMHFYIALTHLALCDSNQGDRQQLEAISDQYKKLRFWGNYGQMNYLHKFQLIEAEKYRVLGEKTAAIEFYDKAIAGAKENEYIQEEALANELAAKFYLDWGKEKVAAGYMQEAYYCYARWGAKAKTEDLKKRYPQLLSPILKTTKHSLYPHKTLTFIHNETLHCSTNRTVVSMLDFATVIKASQALSSEIELDQLLSTLMKVVVENAGADRGVLILREQEQWMIAVRCDDTETCQIQSTPLNENCDVSLHIINTVKRNLEVFVSNDMSQCSFWSNDPYLLRQHPQSVLCSPILNQGKLIGILYLENHLIIGAFTPDRVEVLNLLCSQAAISLENARLYQESQQALEDLQEAQMQIIQSEKMSALGNVVAGVAHEINNPTSFLQGNLKPAQDYVQDLLGLIDLYQFEYPQPSQAIQEEIEEIDLEFMREDLPKLIGSMNLGVERIRNISKSLGIFSREDQEHKTLFNIHDGIDSTLLILKHRTNKTPERSAVEIIKDYANLPQIECFPGQLNQVFMNILANAIDAFDQALINLNPAERKNKKHQIKIQTAVVNENQVEIKIEDNACGMKPETKNRIFEQGFTTKGVGKGTGLGMAIAHQIITEKHSGTITCDSQVGKGTIFTIRLPIF